MFCTLNPPPCRARLALFFDGTYNQECTGTNVHRLYELTAPYGRDNVRQIPKYWKGVGTTPWEGIRGGAFGWGMSRTIRQSYQWLAETCRDEDEVFIFGFSRGAFAAMGLIGFLTWCGLPRDMRNLEKRVKELFKYYSVNTQLSRDHKKPGSRSLSELLSAHPYSLSCVERKVKEEHRTVRVQFVGLFDTVRAAGFEVFKWCGTRQPPEVPPEPELSTGRGTLALRYTRHLPPMVERAFHALAVDEHRAVFHPRVWIVPRNELDTVPAKKDVSEAALRPQITEQRWFIGAHSNVGGGYRDDTLHRVPLIWMRDKAVDAGLSFLGELEQPNGAYLDKDPGSSPRNSYREWLGHIYPLVSWLKFGRPIYAFQEKQERLRIEYAKQAVDRSVLERISAVKSYRPRNIMEWRERLRLDEACRQEMASSDPYLMEWLDRSLD